MNEMCGTLPGQKGVRQSSWAGDMLAGVLRSGHQTSCERIELLEAQWCTSEERESPNFHCSEHTSQTPDFKPMLSILHPDGVGRRAFSNHSSPTV